MSKYKKNLAVLISIALSLVIMSCGNVLGTQNNNTSNITAENITINTIPEYSGNPYVEINNNEPDFSEDEITTESYEYYSE